LERRFLASLLCAFANDVPPCTVANSDIENSELTRTASCRKEQPGITPDRYHDPTSKNPPHNPPRTPPKLSVNLTRPLRPPCALCATNLANPSRLFFAKIPFDDSFRFFKARLDWAEQGRKGRIEMWKVTVGKTKGRRN
jgi:hypothetical protein